MWEIDVCNPDGTTRLTLTPGDPVSAIEWASRGDGDCLEAAITGRGLDIRARDVVIIRARSTPNDPNPPTVRYVGWVVEVPADRSPNLTVTRLIGGRKRLAEILNRNLSVSGDVAAAARTSLSGVTDQGNPRLVVPASFPTQNFTAGPRYPGLEAAAETLEAFEAMVPGFTVEPASASYVYAGRTYAPGMDVPPTRYGVRADGGGGGRGLVYFERPTHVPALLSELADNLTITWLPRSAEQVVDDVTIVLLETHNADAASVLTSGSSWPVPGAEKVVPPVAHRVTAGTPYGAAIRVGAEGQGLKQSSWYAPISSSGGWTDPANAFDGNLATYTYNQATSTFTLVRPAAAAAVAWRIRYSSVAPFYASLTRTVSGGLSSYHRWNLPATQGSQADFYLYAPPFEGIDGPVSIWFHAEMRAWAADEIRIYEATPYEPDPTVLNRLALGHMRLPGNDSTASVTVPNRLLDLAWRWQIDLANGDSVVGTAELIEHRITGSEGLVTTIHLGQALSSTEVSTRALLDGKIARAVRAGTKPTA